jgi:hypothetical protein
MAAVPDVEKVQQSGAGHGWSRKQLSKKRKAYVILSL